MALPTMSPPGEGPDTTRPSAMPETLPVLGLRGTVVFPSTIAPICVEGDRARRLIGDAYAMKTPRLVALVTQRSADGCGRCTEDVYAFGTAAILHDALQGPEDVLRVAVEGIDRVRIVGWTRAEPYRVARVCWLPDVVSPGAELEGLAQQARALFARFVGLMSELSPELAATVERLSDPRQLAYLLASTTPMTIEARQRILEHSSVTAKLRATIAHLEHDIAIRELLHRVARQAAARVPREARREAGELGAAEHATGASDANDGGPPNGASRDPYDPQDARRRLRRLPIPEVVRREVDREIARLERTPATSPESAMIATYLDWVAKMPWEKVAGGPVDLARARSVLDEDHFGLAKVKERIIEYLAVRQLCAERARRSDETKETNETSAGAPPDRGEQRAPILCLVGPPGVGKTSLGQSIARALGRPFARIALGGVHDEAEIRGHRRTYLGAMPGRLLQAIARCAASDPVFVLDEVDKLGVGFHGDPSAALLEALDPAQNNTFVDNYLGVPFDLSRVLFLCTANSVDAIPAPLLDRMEVIALAGYTDAEKVFIARNHLLPKALSAHGLLPGEVSIDDEVVRRIVRDYTREAGVRSLGREIATLLRRAALRLSEGQASPIEVRADALAQVLGVGAFRDEALERIDRPGVALGLAWMPSGGELLFVEATSMPGEERLVLTGMLGNVMRESAQAALSYLRSNGGRLGIDPAAFERKTVHVHVPAGAIPKDGPSAGVTILVALASLALGRPVRADLAMTGEVTLRGRVLAVGGIKEKVLAAQRAGLRAVLLPRGCEPQIDDLPEDARSIRTMLVESAEEALAIALGLSLDDARDRSTQPIPVPSSPAPAF
jgi:ATP-dependent Lon protease